MVAIRAAHGARDVRGARRGRGAALATARRTAFSALARPPTTILEDATVPRSELAR